MRTRGVVVEIGKRNHVIVMTAQGEFVQVPFKKQVYVGQEIQFERKERISLWQVGAAAVLFLALASSWNLLVGQLVPLGVPAYLVTLDINPSLELAVDSGHRVLEAAGLNDDGKKLLSRVDIIGESLSAALDAISRQAQNDGYLRQGNNEIVVTIADKNSHETSLVELKNNRTGDHHKLEQVIVDSLTKNTLAQVRIWQVPAQVLADAKSAGITPARYIAIQRQAQAIAPQRIEARLTVAEASERRDEKETEVHTAAASFGSAPRPVLTPMQWTNTAAVDRVPERQYPTVFSFSNRMKGALSYSE